MRRRGGYRVTPFTQNRRLVAASVAVSRERNTVHGITEVDVTDVKKNLAEHRERTGERLSFTAYVVSCLARVIDEHPQFNAFHKRGKLLIFDDVTISVLVERKFKGEFTPEPFCVQQAQQKSFHQIHEEIRAAQQQKDDRLGSLSGMSWMRFVPNFLLKAVIRKASCNIDIIKRFGVISVTAVGMHGGHHPLWFIPISNATMAVTVGSIVDRTVLRNGEPVTRQHLCLTVTFDHDIIDGAPAARFMKRFAEVLESGDELKEVAHKS